MLPGPLGEGTVTILEPNGGIGRITDAISFYNQGGHSFMAFYSDGGDGQRADSISNGFVPDSHFYVTEGYNGIFEYFSGGVKGRNNDYYGFSDGSARPVPEPGSLTLLGIGAIGLAGYALRRRNS